MYKTLCEKAFTVVLLTVLCSVGIGAYVGSKTTELPSVLTQSEPPGDGCSRGDKHPYCRR